MYCVHAIQCVDMVFDSLHSISLWLGLCALEWWGRLTVQRVHLFIRRS